MSSQPEDKIIAAWKQNAAPWIKAVSEGQILSRVQVTNRAIIDTITTLAPRRALDIGCGEGWLVRALYQAGIDALGIDTIPALINYAQNAGQGRFKTLSYAQLAEHKLTERFDLAVANFSLLGDESVTRLFQTMPSLLNSNGYFIVQTLHPVSACGEHEYKDGWRDGSWRGFNQHFRDPAPWFFRTIESWQRLFIDNGFEIINTFEPTHPSTGEPASIIIVAKSTCR